MLIDLKYLLYITDIDTGAGRDISGVDDSGSPVGETYYRKGVESRQQSVDIGGWRLYGQWPIVDCRFILEIGDWGFERDVRIRMVGKTCAS